MVVVAQLVRASVCGTEGRGFEPHLPPIKSPVYRTFFIPVLYILNSREFLLPHCLVAQPKFERDQRSSHPHCPHQLPSHKNDPCQQWLLIH